MELILLEDIKDLGHRGDVIKVRDGYARNFLLPRKLAQAATRHNRVFVEQQRVRSEKRKAERKRAAEEKAEKMADLKVTIEAKAGEQGKLYGSVTAEEIAAQLIQQGHEFEKKQVHLRQAIRTLGVHPVEVELHPGVRVTVSVEVISQP